MLPSFHIVSSTFHGTDDVRCTIECDSVSAGPDSVNGSYVTIKPWEGRGSEETRIRRCFAAVFGFEPTRKPMTRTIEELLEMAHPKFPWHWTFTKSFDGDGR